MREAPEGGWIQNQHQTTTQPAAVAKNLFPGKQELDVTFLSLNPAAAALLQTQEGLPVQHQERGKTKGGGREGGHLGCYSSRVVCMARHIRMSFQA